MSQISIRNLTYRYPGAYDNVFENFSATLDTDWRLALTGRNGRGKTTLLKLIGGELSPDEGGASCAGACEYFPFSVPDAPDALSALYCARPELELWRLKKEMRGLELAEETLEKPFGTLSGGERTKLLLAALFSEENAFLLIDEPTNHLDETGRKRLAAYLKEKRGFILVSHDRDFLDGLVDKLYEFRDGKVKEHLGTVAEFLERRKLENLNELERHYKPVDEKPAEDREKKAASQQEYQAKKFVSKEEKRRKAEEQARAEAETQRKQEDKQQKEEIAEEPKPAKPEEKTPEPSDLIGKAPSSMPKPERTFRGSFESNKGRLLFPVTGKYKIVGTFGQHRHPDLKYVKVNNNGIDIEAQPGASARAIFDGKVSAVFPQDGYHTVVMVRHGKYLSIYVNLSEIYVRKGDTLKAGQAIGKIYSDPDDGGRTILHFEVRKERDKLDPQQWVK